MQVINNEQYLTLDELKGMDNCTISLQTFFWLMRVYGAKSPYNSTSRVNEAGQTVLETVVTIYDGLFELVQTSTNSKAEYKVYYVGNDTHKNMTELTKEQLKTMDGEVITLDQFNWLMANTNPAKWPTTRQVKSPATGRLVTETMFSIHNGEFEIGQIKGANRTSVFKVYWIGKESPRYKTARASLGI